MQKRFFMMAMFVLVFALPAIGQVLPNCSTPDTLTDEEKKKCVELAERTAGLAAGTRFIKPGVDLMPAEPDAWIVHLITTGGYTGRGLPTVTVRSDGQYACGEGDPLEFKTFSSGGFEALSELMTTSNLTVEKGQKKADEKPGGYMCNDCFVTTLSIARRESKNKVRTYLSSSHLLRYPRISEQFDAIRKAVDGIGLCR